MEELIRTTLHDALDVREPVGLRARVIDGVPMPRSRRISWRPPQINGQWAAAVAAIGLTAALIAGLLYSHIGALPAVKHRPGATIRLAAPEGIAVGANGEVYVSDYVGNRVYVIRPDGSLVTVAGGGFGYDGTATKANLWGPAGLAISPAGDLYIGDNLGGTVRRLDSKGILTTVATIHGAGQNLNSPIGLAFDSAGQLYIGDFNGGVVVLPADGDATRSIDLSGIPSPAIVPGYIAFDSNDNLYVADRSPSASTILGVKIVQPGGGCRIIRIPRFGSPSVIAGTGTCGYSGDGGPASSAQLNDPNGITFDSAGNLYFADSSNHRIRRIDPRGTITTIAGTGVSGHTGDGGRATAAELAYPFGIGISAGHFLYVADSCGCTDPAAYGAVRVIDLRTGIIRMVVDSNSRVIS